MPAAVQIMNEKNAKGETSLAAVSKYIGQRLIKICEGELLSFQ